MRHVHTLKSQDSTDNTQKFLKLLFSLNKKGKLPDSP